MAPEKAARELIPWTLNQVQPQMGLTTLKMEVANPARPARTAELEFLVDSGAIYSVVPATVLRRLGIRPIATEEFSLANGSRIRRRKGVAFFKYGAKVGGADVIFGEPGDAHLLGMLTLEALGLALDPLRRELRPMPMILGGWPALEQRRTSGSRRHR